MRSKNSKQHDALEAAYLADVKRCHCVVCGAQAPSAAHHPEQELHLITVALCWDCHQGPHGWHGDKSRWRAAKMTELRAINDTRRMVDVLRSGAGHGAQRLVMAVQRVKRGAIRKKGELSYNLSTGKVTGLSSSKIIQRKMP
jgi:hypothetical protein